MTPVHCAVAALAVSMPAMPGHAAADGAALFAQHCAPCHQADGSGTVGLAPALKGEHWGKLGADRSYLALVLVHGLSGPIKVGAQAFVGNMPAFGPQLDDATLALIATQVRRLQGAVDDSPYTADEIKAARDKRGSPPLSRERRALLIGN